MLSKPNALFALSVLTLSIAVSAQAQPADYRTYFTFSAPVTLPGVTLPAGKYLFRLADPAGSRKVINVLSEDGTRSLAMLHTIPNQVAEAPKDAEVRFMETSANVPPPIKTWWYPGRRIGYEFIYPRQQAMQLAKGSSDSILTTAKETDDLAKADLSRITGAGAATAVTPEETPAPSSVTGRAQQGQIAGETAQAQPAPPQRSAAAQQSVQPGPVPAQPTPSSSASAASRTRTELPRTASPIPALMLIGAAAMALGLALRSSI